MADPGPLDSSGGQGHPGESAALPKPGSTEPSVSGREESRSASHRLPAAQIQVCEERAEASADPQTRGGLSEHQTTAC